jgi:hypothetical protein
MNIIKRFPVLRRFSTHPPTHTPSKTSSTSSPPSQEWAANQESLEDYGHGGYRPVAVGDVLGSHYCVLRKLGWGVYSTVWLVQHERHVIDLTPVDETSSPNNPFSNKTFGALKVLTGVLDFVLLFLSLSQIL